MTLVAELAVYGVFDADDPRHRGVTHVWLAVGVLGYFLRACICAGL